MLAVWNERVAPLPEKYREAVIRKLNKAGGKDGLIRNTFQELDATVNFVLDHYKVLSSETIQRALFDRYTSAEKDILFEIFRVARLEDGVEKTRARDEIYKRTRSALQKTRRLIIQYTDEVQEQLEAEKRAVEKAQEEEAWREMQTRLESVKQRWGAAGA